MDYQKAKQVSLYLKRRTDQAASMVSQAFQLPAHDRKIWQK